MKKSIEIFNKLLANITINNVDCLKKKENYLITSRFKKIWTPIASYFRAHYFKTMRGNIQHNIKLSLKDYKFIENNKEFIANITTCNEKRKMVRSYLSYYSVDKENIDRYKPLIFPIHFIFYIVLKPCKCKLEDSICSVNFDCFEDKNYFSYVLRRRRGQIDVKIDINGEVSREFLGFLDWLEKNQAFLSELTIMIKLKIYFKAMTAQLDKINFEELQKETMEFLNKFDNHKDTDFFNKKEKLTMVKQQVNDFFLYIKNKRSYIIQNERYD